MNKFFSFLLILLVLVVACTPKTEVSPSEATSEVQTVDANVNELDGDLSELSEDLGLDELNDLEQELAELENLE